MTEYLYPKDEYRYYGGGKLLKHMMLPAPDELRFIKAFRKSQYYYNRNKLLWLWWELRKRKISRRTHIQIQTSTKIGAGFYIGHCGRIIINPKAILGKNINISTGVTIGQTNRGEREGTPIIGDNVWIGTNAVIVGKITIGTDVMIAPNAYVNFDVPSHSIVIGNPATILPRENATVGYINRTI